MNSTSSQRIPGAARATQNSRCGSLGRPGLASPGLGSRVCCAATPSRLCALHALPGLLPQGVRRHRDLQQSEEHTSELQSQSNLVCRLLLEKKKQDTPYRLAST